MNSQDDSEEELSSTSASSIINSTIKKEIPAVIESEEESMPSILVKANYNFTAESENELSIKKGDKITVIKRIDEGWWIGSCNGKSGMFPSNYVTTIDENECSEKDKESSSNITDQSKIGSDEIDESKFMQTVSKPGFSYLPKGVPIKFIGRKGNHSSEEDQVNVSTSCGQCDCEDFAANVFKQGHCNNCFHKH